MKFLALAALAAALAFSQNTDCETQETCQALIRANPKSSLAHFRLGEILFQAGAYQEAANNFRAATAGDLQPQWTVVWSHINTGKIFDITGSRDRALNEYRRAQQTGDNTRGALDEAAKYVAEPFRRN